MLPQLKSEFRKLLTVRSTYILTIIALILTVLFAYFGTSAMTYSEAVCDSTGEALYSRDYSDERLQQAAPEDICGGTVTYLTKTDTTLPKEKFLYSLQETLPVTATFVSLILILLVVHEFRYNTINYTLTINNSRTKVFLSKLLVGVIFTILVTALAIGVSLATLFIAMNVKGLSLPAQDYNWTYVLGRHFTYVLGNSLFCMGIALLIRNQVASIAAVFVLPMIDGIISMLLMIRELEPTKLLPFSALERFGNVAADLTGPGIDASERFGRLSDTSQATVTGSLLVFSAYLALLLVVTWILFLRRDAN